MFAIYLIFAVLVLGLGAYAIYLTRRIRLQQSLSLGDHLSAANFIFGMAIGVVALGIALASFKVAIDSYRAAERSGKAQDESAREQLAALEASRKAIVETGTDQKKLLDRSRAALEAVLKSSQQQQRILDKSLRTSETQLNILLEQRKREAERPGVALLLVQPKELQAIIYNLSTSKVARDAHYAVNFVFVDRRRPDGTYPVLSTATTTVDYVRPSSGYLPSVLQFHNSVPSQLELERGCSDGLLSRVLIVTKSGCTGSTGSIRRRVFI